MSYHGCDLRKGRYSDSGRPYLITVVTQFRVPVFNDFYLARMLVNEFRSLNDSGVVESLAWVIMPDHLHWLFIPQDSSISSAVRQLKGRSSWRIHKMLGKRGPLWQKGFHDRALRKQEDIQAVARYVVANPLRAGIVRRVGDYPHWDAVWL
jgi:REP element-mobilizing transposase RayT